MIMMVMIVMVVLVIYCYRVHCSCSFSSFWSLLKLLRPILLFFSITSWTALRGGGQMPKAACWGGGGGEMGEFFDFFLPSNSRWLCLSTLLQSRRKTPQCQHPWYFALGHFLFIKFGQTFMICSELSSGDRHLISFREFSWVLREKFIEKGDFLKLKEIVDLDMVGVNLLPVSLPPPLVPLHLTVAHKWIPCKTSDSFKLDF